MHWFHKTWWRYLLAPRKEYDCSWFTTVRCRLSGHPKGVVWYNPGRLEPNMHCVTCGDNLG